uniref:rho GTPase-activating protein gacF-like n=1 Tax=Styela clava TaxID=7725 RepID=UPI00193A6CF6|nr:rho GTPase-activating protein gacF-like [Styela clava]
MNSSPLNNSITPFLSPASSSENQQNETNSLNLSESSDSESPISLIFDADSSDDLSEEELVDMDVPMFSNCSSGDEMGSKATSDYSGEKHCLDSVCDMKNISSNSEISLKTSLTDSQLDAIMDDSFSQENIAHSSRIPNNENVETFENSYGFSVTSPTQTISKNDLSKTTQNKNIYQGPAQFSEKKQEPPASQNSGHSVEKRVSNNLVLSPDVIKAMDISDSVISTPCSSNKNSRRSDNLKTEKSFSNLILSPAILKEMDVSFSPCNSADNSIIASNTVSGLSKSTNNSNCTKPKPICDRYSNSKYKEANTSSSHAKGSPYVSLGQPTSKEKFSVYNSSNSKPKSALPTSSYAGDILSPHVSLGQPVSSTSTPKSHIHAKVLNQKWKLPLNSFSNAAMSPYVSLGQPVDSKTILEKSKFVKIGSAADVSTVSDNSLEDLFDMTTFGSKSSNTENSKFDSTFSIENLDKAFNFSDLSCNESFSDNITDEKITIPDTKKSTDKNNAVLRKRKSPTVIVSPTQSKSSKIASNCPSTPSNHVTHEQFIEEEQLILSSQKSPINSKRKLKKKHTGARKSIITESKKKIPTSKNEIIKTDCKNKEIKMTSLNDITNTQDKDANIMNNISSGLNTGEDDGFIASSQTLVPTAVPVTQISQKLTASQTGLTIIDVCSHTELFNTFMEEWNSKTCFSFAVATRSNETHKVGD